MTASQAAAKWGITARRVQILCQQGRVPGAKQEVINGRNTWVMPEQGPPEKLKPGSPGKKNPR
jgi:hypothetical protein